MSPMFPRPDDEINRIRHKDGVQSKSEGVKKVLENVKFIQKVEEKPLENDVRVKVFGVEYISFTDFLRSRIWTRGIYTTDKLVRLGYGSGLEFLKRYLKKKRTVPFNLLWLIIIMFGVVAAILVIIFLLPKFTGG